MLLVIVEMSSLEEEVAGLPRELRRSYIDSATRIIGPGESLR